MTFRSSIFADRQHITSDDRHRLEAGKSVSASQIAGDRCLRWSSSKEVEASPSGPRDERLFVSLRGDRGFAGLADLRAQCSPSSRSVQPETSWKVSRSVVSALEAGWRESFARTDLPGGSCSPNPYGSTERSLPSLSGHPSGVEVVLAKQSLVDIIRNRHKDAAGPDQQVSPHAEQTPFRSSSGSEAFAQDRRSASSEPQDLRIRDPGSPATNFEVTGRDEAPEAEGERRLGQAGALQAEASQSPPTPRQVRIQADSRQAYSPEVTEALRERVAMLETLLAKGSPLKVGKGLPPPRQDEESSSRTLSEDSVAARSAPVRTPVASQRSRSVRISNQSSCFDSKSGGGSPRHEASDSSKHSVEKTGKADSEGTSDIAEGEVAPKSAVEQGGASSKSAQKGKGPPPPKGGAKGAFSAPPAPGKGKVKGKPAPPKAPPRAGAKAGLTKEAHNPRKAEIQPRLPMKKLFWNAFVLDDEHLRSCENVWAAIEKENADLYSFDVQELEQLFSETSSRSGVQTPVSHGVLNETLQVQATAYSAVRSEGIRTGALLCEVLECQGEWCGMMLLGSAMEAAQRCTDEPDSEQECLRNPAVDRWKRRKCALRTVTQVKAIHDMDDDCLDKVELLLATAPTAEELTMLHAAAKEMPEKASLPWDDAEDFVWKLAEVGHFLVRLQTWSFENAFEERFHIFHSAVTEVKDACHALRDSHRIPRLLGITLNVGNYLNAGTSRGRADGFSVEVLSQMRALKGQAASSSSASTLLDFVVRQAERSRPGELLQLFGEVGEATLVQRAFRHNLKELSLELTAYCVQARGLARQSSNGDDVLKARAGKVEAHLRDLETLQRLFVEAEEDFNSVSDTASAFVRDVCTLRGSTKALERSRSANANPAHLLWQERVDKERKLAKRQIMKQLVLDGEEQRDAEPEAPPLHDLHQCMSLPALGASSFTPMLPKIGTSASRSMTGRRPGST
ncbi:FMN2, partial [Symbiodinium sp. CCMP2456]